MKKKKVGFDLYAHVTRAFNSLPRKGIGPLLYCISVVGLPSVMEKCVHIFPEPEEKERKKGNMRSP